MHLSVKAAEAGVDAGDDKTCIGNGVALQHKGYGGGVLVAGNMDADTVVVEAAVANDHVAELTAGSLMTLDGLAGLDLLQLGTQIDGGVGQVLQSLTQNDLVRILVEPKNALTRQYQSLLAMDGVELEISDEALLKIADKAIDRQIGARGLRAIMEKVMMKIMYEIPSDLSIKKVIITSDCIDGGEPRIVRDAAHPREALSGSKI